MRQVGWVGCSLAALTFAACQVRSAHDVQRDSPLGPSFWLNPVPSETPSLLGRSFKRPPDAAFSLTEQSEPNPCEAALPAPTQAAMSNHYENAMDLSSTGNGQALLGLFGMTAEASHVSHLLFKVQTSQRLERLDSNEYVACCKTHDCGWGYVSALIYGDGEYLSGQQTDAAASGNYEVIQLKGNLHYRVLERKQIHGWLAAVLTAHDRSQAIQACPAGEHWRAIECVDEDTTYAARENCATDRSSDPFWKDSPQMQHSLKEQQASACRWLDDHGIERPRPAP
jgi:hypothetical protein